MNSTRYRVMSGRVGTSSRRSATGATPASLFALGDFQRGTLSKLNLDNIDPSDSRLEKEKSHYEAARKALRMKGDVAAASEAEQKLLEIQDAIEGVNRRAANVRAGYVYVISNIGSFGQSVAKIGMTRRLAPMDRVRELGDASVPFRFDVHAIIYASGIFLRDPARCEGCAAGTPGEPAVLRRGPRGLGMAPEPVEYTRAEVPPGGSRAIG